jgi:hypothetical protein
MCTSKSAIPRAFGFALEVNVFRQFGTRQRLTNTVVTDVGDLTQALKETERLKYSGVDADADARVSSFDSLQGGPGGKCSLGDDGHGKPSTTASVVDIRPELVQGSLYGSGRKVRRRHL